MTHVLTLYDVRNLLQSEQRSYNCVLYEYGFLIEYKNTAGITVKYYFNQNGDYIYPTDENLGTMGKQIGQERND
jgi:hypothetical protein